MDTHPYHNYLFFDLAPDFYHLSAAEQSKTKSSLEKLLTETTNIIVTPYLTRGYKPDTVFMLWCRSLNPEAIQEFLGNIHRTEMGRWLKLTHTYFGIVRASQYSGRTGNPDQVIQNFETRLPYFILYPFTKTHEWHQLDLPKRKSVMYEHMNLGLEFSKIRQCLLYSYGLDNYEFMVSYEAETLEVFQDLVIKLRSTAGRPYTLIDTPIYTCIYHPIHKLLEVL